MYPDPSTGHRQYRYTKVPGVYRWRVEPTDEPLGTQTNRRGKSGTGEQVNNGGPQDVRLEVLADHSTEVHMLL